MVRQQEFDEAEVLTRAMGTFRRRGYAGVSIKTLEAETGLSSGSLYNSFGSKAQIFEHVLEHYNDVVVAGRIRRYLTEAQTPAEGLVALCVSLLDEPDGGAFGCLLTNSAIEFPNSDTRAGAEIRRGFDLLRAAFAAALRGVPGVQPGTVGPLSLRLLTYYQGLLVLIRHGYDPSILRSTIRSDVHALIGHQDD